MCQNLFGYSGASQRDSGQASIVCRSIASEAPYCRRTLCRIFRSAMAFRVARLSHPQIEKGLKTDAVVAHALVRAVFALLRTQASGIDHSVHKSVNAARMSACATSSSALVGQQGHGNSLSSAQTQKP